MSIQPTLVRLSWLTPQCTAEQVPLQSQLSCNADSTQNTLLKISLLIAVIGLVLLPLQQRNVRVDGGAAWCAPTAVRPGALQYCTALNAY